MTQNYAQIKTDKLSEMKSNIEWNCAELIWEQCDKMGLLYDSTIFPSRLDLIVTSSTPPRVKHGVIVDVNVIMSDRNTGGENL